MVISSLATDEAYSAFCATSPMLAVICSMVAATVCELLETLFVE